jgi:ferredoxin
LLSLLVERPFCKYACPYGAVLGLFNFIRMFRIKRNPETCIDCKACDRNCPMNIQVSTGRTVWHHQCITCMKCTSEQSCPVDRTVELMVGGFEPAHVSAGGSGTVAAGVVGTAEAAGTGSAKGEEVSE